MNSAGTMTNKELNAAIAVACGWTLRKRVCHNGSWRDVPTWFSPEFANWPKDSSPAGQCLGGMPPNYLKDLNAIHRAVASQPTTFRITFDELLHAVAQNRELFVTMLEAQDWAEVFITLAQESTTFTLEGDHPGEHDVVQDAINEAALHQ